MNTTSPVARRIGSSSTLEALGHFNPITSWDALRPPVRGQAARDAED